MSKTFALLLCLAAPFLADGPAAAAHIGLTEAADAWLIELRGPIGEGDAQRLDAAIRATAVRPKRIVAALSSNGGDLVQATTMGLALREAGAVAYVGDGSICISACGIAWLGGTNRVVSASGHIGFHAAYDEKTRQVTTEGREWLASYLAALGVAPSFLDYIYAKRLGQGLEWLTDGDARAYGLGMIVAPSSAAPETMGSTDFVDTLDRADSAYRAGGDERLVEGLRTAYAAFARAPSMRRAFACFATEIADSGIEERASAAEGRAVDRRLVQKAWEARMNVILAQLGYDAATSQDILNTWIGLSNRTLASQE